MSEAVTKYKDDWLSVIYDATGDYEKSKRAIELAELNGLFDPIEALAAAKPNQIAGDLDASGWTGPARYNPHSRR